MSQEQPTLNELRLARARISCAWGRYRASWVIRAYGKRKGGTWQAAAALSDALRYLKALETEADD